MKPLIQYDAESILSEEVFTEIFDQEDEIKKAQMLLSFQDRAKELGVKYKFDTMIRAYQKVKRTMNQKNAGQCSAMNNCTDFTGKYDDMKCGAWIADDGGIYTFNKDYSNQVVVCYHPILPIGRLKNLETGEEQIKLAFKRNHRWTEITIPKDIISSSNKIVGLSKLGIAVTSENAKNLVKFLSDVENLNDEEIPVQQSTSKLGWIAGGFIPYDTDIIFDGDMQFRQVYESIAIRGSEDTWINYVKELRRNKSLEVKFSIAASLGSVLVGKLGALPFIIDFWGETGNGKSISMMLAASVWANPDKHRYIGDFESTSVQLEIRADLLNNFPLMLDDTSKMSEKVRNDFEGLVYALCSGKGKSRSNKDLGIRKENHWENIILTNGERPLTSYVTQGGAMNRVVEIECKGLIYDDPRKAIELLKTNYGHIGKRFIKILKNLGDDELKQMHTKILYELEKKSETTQKQNLAMSILLLADKIATERIFHDSQYITLDEAREVMQDKNVISEHERCYFYLIDKIAMNSQRFDMSANVEQWGIIIEEGYAVMYPQAVKDLCLQGNYSYKAFMNWAERNNVIQTDGKQQTKLKKIKGKPVRCVWLKISEFMDKNGFEPAELYMQEELPFC